MYDLKRSIRRHAVGCAGLLCLLLVVASASRCTSDSITGGENPGPEVPALPGNPGPPDPDPVDTPLGVGSVTLSPDSLTVGVQESAQLSVIVRDTDGAVIPDPQVVFTVSRLPRGTVDSNGLVTGLAGGYGVGTVMAWSRGVNSNAAVITVKSKVGSVTLSPDSLTIGQLGGTAQLGVIVRDTTGAVMANPQVVFRVSGRVTVDSTGLVTAFGCGVGTIAAQSEGVDSNVVVVDVDPPSGIGCWDYYSPWAY